MSGEYASPYALWLSKKMTESEITVAELAQKSETTAVTIYNILAGRVRNPQKATRESLQTALEDSPDSNEEKKIEAAATVAGIGQLQDFDPYDVENIPDSQGVYVFYDISERPVYVGRSNNMMRRIKQHSDRFWFKKPLVENGSYIETETEELTQQLEEALIKFLKSNAVLNQNLVDRDLQDNE